MADTIDFVAEDEVQPEEIDFQEEVAPVVRIVPPGSLNPDELLPAVRKIGGALAVGEPGDTHPDIIKRDKIPATDIDQRGFAGLQGEFYDRESAAQGTQLPTEMEPGRLHSTDLRSAQSPEIPTKKTTSDFGTMMAPGVASAVPFPELVSAAAKGIGGVLATGLNLIRPTTWLPEEAKPKQFVIPLSPETEARGIGMETPQEQRSREAREMFAVGKPLYEIEPGSPAQENELNRLLSRWSTPEGIAQFSASAHPLGGFAVLIGMVPDLVGQIKDVVEGKGTDEEKRDRVNDLMAISLMTAHGKAREASKPEIAASVPTKEPVPVKPTEAAVPEVPIAEMAKRGEDIGATHYGREAGKDKFRFTDETKEPGQPNQITFTVPEGSSKTEIADARKLAYARDRVAEGIPEENIQVSVNNLGPEFPGKGFVQVDEVRHPKAGNVFSANPEIMRKAGLDMPTSAELLTLPNGNYTLPEVRKLLAEKKAPVEPTPAAPVGLPEPKEGTVRVFSGGRGSSWYTTNIKRAGDFAKRNAGILNWVDVPKDVFDSASVAAKEAGSFTEGDALLPNEWVKKSANLRETLLKQAKEKPAVPAAPKPIEPAPVATVPEPELVAMGAAREGEKPTTSQIEQLAQSMRGVQESKAPLGQQIREAFNIGQRFATARSAIGQAVSGLKTAGDLLINKWKGVEKIDDLLRAKGRLSQQIEARGWRLRQWEKAAQKAIPSARDQAAIAKWVDAGGDRATLEKGLAESPAKFKQAYADALALKGDKLTAAQNVQNYFESRLQEAIDAGVLDHGVENYIHRMYESKPDLLKRALAYTQTGLLKTNPSLAKKRVFQFDWEAEKEGYFPVQSFIKRITAYEASLSKAIAAREFIKKASELKASDGRPIIDIKGVGIPIEDPAGVYREATLIKPKYNPTKNNEPLLPTGAPNPNYRGDYANRDYRALSRWKWVGSDAGGKPIFVQGDVAIHPDYVGKIDVLLQPSQVRYGRYGKILRPALGASSVMKQTMLDLSGFHYVQITVHGMEHRVFPWNIIKDIDLANPNVDGLLRGGVSLGGDYGGAFREGLVGSSLTRLIPGLGNAIEAYHQWLFQDYIPRIKMTMALHALERNRERFGETMSEEEIFRKTANQANAAFGELNYIMLERSKTAQDISRLILLAPDFLEARARFALQAFEKGGKRFGNEPRKHG